MTLRRILAAAGAAVVLGLVLLGFGLELPFVLGWGLTAGAVVLTLQAVLTEEQSENALRLHVERDARTTEVSSLAWALNPRTGLAGERVVRRVREIIRHRLARIGIDADAPEHAPWRDAALGHDVWHSLNRQGTSITDIVRALDAVDRLSPTKEKR